MSTYSSQTALLASGDVSPLAGILLHPHPAIQEVAGPPGFQGAEESNTVTKDDIIDAILPPREWVEAGKHTVSYVSHMPAARVDIARLRELLDR